MVSCCYMHVLCVYTNLKNNINTLMCEIHMCVFFSDWDKIERNTLSHLWWDVALYMCGGNVSPYSSLQSEVWTCRFVFCRVFYFLIFMKWGFSTFSSYAATFTLSYQLMGHKVINEYNLFRCHGSFLKIPVPYYCKHVHIFFNNVFNKMIH
jgi:hypothetical protein